MDVFISYAREDHERAHTVASALQACGWSVWWDREVKAGQAFDQVIERELETAKSVIVLWSKYSITSDWVKSEAAAAMQRGVLVPAVIDTVKVPLEFSRRHTADLIGWDGDMSHPKFRALCDGVAETGVPPALTPITSANRPAARGSWTQRLVLKGRWQTLPGILLASAALLASLAALIAALNQVVSRRADHTAPPQGSESKQPAGNPRAQPIAPSTDRDKPTWLTSNEIRGRGVGERVSYYYACNAGPGVITVTVDGKNKVSLGSFASAVWVELSNMDAESLLINNLGYTTDDRRKVARVELSRHQRIIIRVLLDEITIDYMVRLEGAVDFGRPPK
jgi:hypothetical protein